MDDFNPLQLITLCAVFIGFHLVALPLFLWAMRHRQFSGREQKEWNLEPGVSPETPYASVQAGPMPVKARVMLTILSVLGLGVLGMVILTLIVAIHAAAHTAGGANPF